MAREPLPLDITIGAKYGPTLEIQTQEDADAYLSLLIEHSMECHSLTREEAERIERDNVGYFAGYGTEADRERVERLFRCAHPFFGAIAEKGAPTPEQALGLGIALGIAARAREDAP